MVGFTISSTTAAAPDQRRRSHGKAVVAASIVVAALLLGGGFGWLSGEASYFGDPALAPAMSASFGFLGLWVTRRGPRVIGVRMVAIGLAAGVSWAAQAWSRFEAVSWLSQWLWPLPLLLVPLVLVRFPDDSPPKRWRWLELALLAAALLPLLFLAAAALGAPRNLLSGGEPAPPQWTKPLLSATIAALAIWLILCLLTGGLLVLRLWRAHGRERAQLVCLGLGLTGLLLGVGLLIIGAGPPAEAATAAALPAALAAAVVRYSWYDLDLTINRVLVWTALTAIVAAGFVLLVALLNLAVPGTAVTWPELLVLLVFAFTVEPLRHRLQAGVSRLLFGRRSAPLEAVSDLSKSMSRATTIESGEMLCRAVATTLQLPWAAILDLDGKTTAQWGRRLDDMRRLPLQLGERRLGDLAVCPRRIGERWTRAERAILDGMAAQVAVAVETMTLASRLRRSQQRVVASGEEERQRLRHDLHDGLGPALVGLRLQIAACAQTSRDDALSSALHQVADEVGQCVAEVGRVLDGLRPAALDHGLLHAIRYEARRLSSTSTNISVTATEPPPAVADTVEIAAYRIACEAIANAVKHAGATTVCVDIRPSRTTAGLYCILTVADNGHGLGPERADAIGLLSMQHRAEDAGGKLTVTSIHGAGVTITAELPTKLQQR